jgi:hypothetical protein
MRAGVLGEGEKVMGTGVSQREEVSYGGQRRTCMISLLLLKVLEMQ